MNIKKALLSLLMTLSVIAVGAQAVDTYQQPETHTLIITSEPGGAVVEIEGPNSYYTKAITPVSLILPAAEYNIKVSKEGYKPASGKLKLDRNKKMNVELREIAVEKKYSLKINSNVSTAIVEVSGAKINTVTGVTPVLLKLPEGTYNIKVEKEGYTSFKTKITLNSDRTLTANIYPMTVNQKIRLYVDCNAPNAIVTVNSNNIKETKFPAPVSIILPRGVYSITVEAPGYKSETREIELYSDTKESFFLKNETSKLTLSVITNIPDSTIQIFNENGQRVYIGEGRAIVNFSPGQYTVTVSAHDYEAQTRRINLIQDSELNIVLSKPMGSITIDIPETMMNNTITNPESMIKVIINGEIYSGTYFELPQGQYTIAIISGAIKLEYVLYIQNGKNYTLKPVTDFMLTVD